MSTQPVAGTAAYSAETDSMVVLNDDLRRLGLPDTQQDLLDFLG